MKTFPALLALTCAALAQLPDDSRLAPPKDLSGDFSWKPVAKDAWPARAAHVKQQMRVALGLWPEPTRTPLNAVIHGKVERDGYSVEKVFFESMPGLFHTGNLYRPTGMKGKHPAVVVTHGHWVDARFWEKKDADLKKEIEAGHERSLIGGRTIFQSIGVQLARMGCVAFVSDMLGNSDSQQISQEIAHGFKKQRPEMISAEAGKWGLYSPQAETDSQNIMGLQTWNNIRSLDFLAALDDVDAKRLAVTGASGGGTQSMILAALDPRIAVAVPCVMVSTAMQGGCTCENASVLRIGTGNIEFAALFAPKPMGLTTAKDWTVNLATKGFPEFQQHWATLGAPDAVQLFNYPDFPHNYNLVTREHIYDFLNKHFRMRLPADRLKERDYEPLTRDQLSVWNAQHPAPEGGPRFEKKLLGWWHEDTRKQLETDIPGFRKIAQPALVALVGNTLAGAGDAEARILGTREFKQPDKPKLMLTDFEISNTTHREQLPARALNLAAKGEPLVIWLDAGGRKALLADGSAGNTIRSLAARGVAVVGIDAFMQGDFLAPGTSDTPTRKVQNPREAACFTAGYNHPLVVQRIHDVLTTLKWARGLDPKPRRIAIIGVDSITAPIAAAAAALSGDAVGALVVDTGRFRFQKTPDIRDASFLPGAGRFGDVPGLLALAAPRKLFLMGEGEIGPDLVTAAYETAGVPDTLRVSAQRDLDAAAKWLVEQLK
ncbi:MAG: acetylxylan esterase [Chthoniobacteraceae bacterium]